MNNIFTTSDMHGRTIHAVVEHQPGQFYSETLADQPHVLLTAWELAANKAMDEAHEKAMLAYYGPDFSDQAFVPDLYRTEAAAKRATQLYAAFAATHEDLEAYSAPSECGAVSYCSLERELDALQEMFAIRPTPNPYAERGLEDRTRPVGELLGFGRMVDDYDVLVALGERPALG